MQIIFLLVGILLGAVAAWFYAKGKFFKPQGCSLEQYTLLDKEKSILQERLSNTLAEKEKTENELALERKELDSARVRLGGAEEHFKNQKEKLDEKQKELDGMQKKLTTEFENIASRLLEEKSKKFTEQNKTNLDGILNPLKDRIKEFESKVDQTYKAELAERVTLKTEIKNLIDLNKQISLEANNLAVALKGNNKQQGNWGEVILEKILERSGLIKDQEYKTQLSAITEEGRRQQPDVTIFLPDNKHLIIDAKVSLVAYEACVNALNDIDRERYIKDHIISVRSHIKILSDKNYQALGGINTPDFVLLFVPIESSFSIAVQADLELFDFAWSRKIVIVSPSTLLATLRTVSSVWKQERQSRNVMEIANQSGKLYDKFVGFMEDMERIAKNIELTRTAYDSAFGKLKNGNGNLISSVEKIRKLGAKTTKLLPDKFLDTDDILQIQNE
jgi:DNA recombination protein RmuC